jgi:hypothetical protein
MCLGFFNARWTIMMTVPRSPSLAEEGRDETVKDLTPRATAGGTCAIEITANNMISSSKLSHRL